jgi:hypothetical protein
MSDALEKNDSLTKKKIRKMRHGFFRRKFLVFAEKNFVGQNTRRKATKIGVENRAQHA